MGVHPWVFPLSQRRENGEVPAHPLHHIDPRRPCPSRPRPKDGCEDERSGHDVLYYENIEGGHAGAADNKQAAFMQALAYKFLWNELKK